MIGYQLTQTGAEIQADLDKVEDLANVKTLGKGLHLDANGALNADVDATEGSNGQLLSTTGSAAGWTNRLPIITSNPLSDPNIPSGQVVICVVASEPSTKYDNVIYIVTGAS